MLEVYVRSMGVSRLQLVEHCTQVGQNHYNDEHNHRHHQQQEHPEVEHHSQYDHRQDGGTWNEV